MRAMRTLLAVGAVLLALLTGSLALSTGSHLVNAGVEALQYPGAVRGMIFTVVLLGVTAGLLWWAAIALGWLKPASERRS
jgi:hypothetical protein